MSAILSLIEITTNTGLVLAHEYWSGFAIFIYEEVSLTMRHNWSLSDFLDTCFGLVSVIYICGVYRNTIGY
jgi:hypothetical protein